MKLVIKIGQPISVALAGKGLLEHHLGNDPRSHSSAGPTLSGYIKRRVAGATLAKEEIFSGGVGQDRKLVGLGLCLRVYILCRCPHGSD